MRKLFVLLALTGFVVSAATADVYLLPAKPGAKSQIVGVNDEVRTSLPIPRQLDTKSTVDMWLENTDGGTGNYVLVGVNSVDTFGVWFEPPAACSILAVEFTNMSYSDPTLTQYFGFVATVDQTVDYANAFPEYHSATTPGPSGWITAYLAGPDTFYVKYADTLWNMDTLWLTTPYNDSLDIFFGGWAKATPDSSPNPYIYANGNPPFHTLMYRLPSDPTGTVGWYSSHHCIRVRALVRMYENPPPVLVDWDKLPDTYNTGVLTATAHWTDFGVPTDSGGVAVAGLVYDVNGGVSDTLLSTTPISGDSTDGVWSFDIPGASVGDTVTYYVYATDLQGKTTVSTTTHSYIIRAGTAGNFLFVIGADEIYGVGYDPISKYYGGKFDLWDAYSYGDPDQSVIDFYNTGGGMPVIAWVSWGGTGFAADTTYIKSFLDNGGALWLAGQDVLYGITGTYGEWTAATGSFLRDYFKLKGGYDDFMTDSMFTQYGVPGDTITGNLAQIWVAPYWSLAPGYDYAGKIDSLDTGAGAVPDFYYETGEIGGYWYEDAVNGYKIAFQYWPWNYICPDTDASGVDTVSQDTLTINILSGLFGVPTGIENPNPIPFPKLLTKNIMVTGNRNVGIKFTIPTKGDVSLDIYDGLGRHIANVIKGKLDGGIHKYTWKTEGVASGAYFYRLTYNGKEVGTSKALVIR